MELLTPPITAPFDASLRPMVATLALFLVGGALSPALAVPLAPEPPLTPAQVAVVEIAAPDDQWDATVFARPWWGAPMAGQVRHGARIPVRGVAVSADARGCSTRLWFALVPFGFICSNQTRPTDQPATTEPVLAPVDATPVPFRYVMVNKPEGEFIPMWPSVEALMTGQEPDRQLGRGDSVALSDKVVRVDDESFYVAIDGRVLPTEGTYTVRNFSQWQGLQLPPGTHLPFGWVSQRKAPVFDAPGPGGKKVEDVARRTRLDLLEELAVGSARWVRIGDARWMKADHLNEVRLVERPESTLQARQWIDVDLGEQVAVAYVDDKPVFATVTASGRAPNHTPRGDYPIWGKVSTITMKSQGYDDKPYYVDKVPWVLFFQAHNALHGAYWHDGFGAQRSHGCVNLSPLDSRYLFDWLEPELPPGWTAIRFWDLTKSPVVHVRNTKRTKPFLQERPIGPPDKEDEQKRLEAAVARREAEAAAAAALLASQPTTAVPVAPAAPGTIPTAVPAAPVAQ